jgi:hypothetical protein
MKIQLYTELMFVKYAVKVFMLLIFWKSIFWHILISRGTHVIYVVDNWEMILVIEDIWWIFMGRKYPVTIVTRISAHLLESKFIREMHMALCTNSWQRVHWNLFELTPLLQGQLNSEWIYEVIISPKMQNKNYKDFCPTIQTRIIALFLVSVGSFFGYNPCLFGRAEILVKFRFAFWEKQWPHKFILNLTDL